MKWTIIATPLFGSKTSLLVSVSKVTSAIGEGQRGREREREREREKKKKKKKKTKKTKKTKKKTKKKKKKKKKRKRETYEMGNGAHLVDKGRSFCVQHS